MTVSSNKNSNRYVATNLQTVFVYDFRILSDAHLDVYQEGVLITLTTNYTVSNVGADGGGNVTLVVGATTGDTITILRNIPFTQLTDYVENDAFPAQTHEDALDLSVMALQEMDERIDRAVVLDVESTATGITMPSPAPGDFIRWNSGGTGFENATALGAQGAVYNEGGAAVDFRIESDNSTHMFFLDGSADRVGIALGNLAPTDGVLHIQSASAGSVAAFVTFFAGV